MFYVIKNEKGTYWNHERWESLASASLFSLEQKQGWLLPDGEEFVPLIYKNHWGIRVCSEIPVGGVAQNNRIEFLGDAMFYEGGIDLAFEEHLKECENDDHDTCWESNGSETWIIGDWKKDSSGLYELDKDGEKGYSAIVGETYTQVVWSKTMQRCELCSLCYPGQGDLGSTGDFLTYDLPKDMYGFEDKIK